MRMISVFCSAVLALSVAVTAWPGPVHAGEAASRGIMQTALPAVMCLGRNQMARAAQLLTYGPESRTMENVADMINAEDAANACIAAEVRFRALDAGELESDGRFAYKMQLIEIVAVYSPVTRQWSDFPMLFHTYMLTNWCMRVKVI